MDTCTLEVIEGKEHRHYEVIGRRRHRYYTGVREGWRYRLFEVIDELVFLIDLIP